MMNRSGLPGNGHGRGSIVMGANRSDRPRTQAMHKRSGTISWINRLILLGALSGLLSACGESEPQPKDPRTPVVATRVRLKPVSEQIEASGELVAKNRAQVAAQIAGEITSVLAEEGDSVRAEQTVVAIDPERRVLERNRARAQVAEARADVQEKERDFERVRALAKHGATSRSRLHEATTNRTAARARLLAAEADLGVAERALRDASVVARFDGVLGRRWVSHGEFVERGQKLFELVSLDPLEVEFHLPEADASRVRTGQTIDFQVAPYPDEKFLGTVSMVAPTIDKRTRTLRVKALVSNPDRRLRPGFFARIQLEVARQRSAAMIPEESVLRRSDGAVVYRIGSNQRVERIVIETGVTRRDQIEVTRGLAPDDLIVQRGNADLIDGAAVLIRNPDGSPAIASAPRNDEKGAHP